MPTKPLSHAKRRGRPPNANRHSQERYEKDVRRQDPALLRAKKMRSSMQWQKVREIRLNRNPVCQDPFGIHARERRPVAATEVDHIVSIFDAPSRAYDLSNTQSLCKSCHARKTGQERSERYQEKQGQAEAKTEASIDVQSEVVSVDMQPEVEA